MNGNNSDNGHIRSTSTTTQQEKRRWLIPVFWGMIVVGLFWLSFLAERYLFDDDDDNNKIADGNIRPTTTSTTMFDSWDDLVQDTRDTMTEAATFQRTTTIRPSSSQSSSSPSKISIVLDDYIELFLRHESAQEGGYDHGPFDDFLVSIGEKDVTMTVWDPPLPRYTTSNKIGDGNKATTSSSSPPLFTSKRTVSYMHPVNNPLAPPWARSVKDQHVHVFDDGRHMVVLTSTTVHDVPKANCFTVEDRLLIDLVDSDDDDATSLVNWSSYFTIVFHKSTMFKGVITRSTTKEYLDHWTSYRDYVLQHGPFGTMVDNSSSDKLDVAGKNQLKRSSDRRRSSRGRRHRPHAHTPLPWLSFMVGGDRPLLSFGGGAGGDSGRSGVFTQVRSAIKKMRDGT